MSRITIADLNTVNQVTELSEAELTTAKGGTFGLLRVLFGGFFGGYHYCGGYGGGYGGGKGGGYGGGYGGGKGGGHH